jgi:UDP-3-O-[3-hydroxymyristoyl] glucosamine N-acyltransferase
MSEVGPICLGPVSIGELAAQHGGEVRDARAAVRWVERVVPVQRAGAGDLAPLLAARFVKAALDAHARGAMLLVDASLAARGDLAPVIASSWAHAEATWALAAVLDTCRVHDVPARWGEGTVIGANAWLGPRVVLGRNVEIGAGCVIGAPGFGWATSGARARRVPQLGGVIIEDDVAIGPLSTIDAGTLAPTRIRRGAKLDAHCHVAHNCDIGEGCMIAAQSGFAGSVVVGRGAMIGGQVGVADHVTIGDGARIAAKSGVIGDVPANAVVAGYPAVSRARWLRGFALLYRARRTDAP